MPYRYLDGLFDNLWRDWQSQDARTVINGHREVVFADNGETQAVYFGGRKVLEGESLSPADVVDALGMIAVRRHVVNNEMPELARELSTAEEVEKRRDRLRQRIEELQNELESL